MDRLGIDIGSKTIKLALVSGEDGSTVYSAYIRHFSKVADKLQRSLRDMVWKHGDREVQVTVTGSAGLRVAELFGIPFVQEVVALKQAVAAELPGTDVVLEMGGEDTKLVYLTGTPEQRMNTVCAGGTGGFIDMMAGLMGKRNEDMDELAQGYETIYPIASRCAVFAQSDVRPLLNAGARKADIAASVLEAVCTQAVAGLSAGRPIEGDVALLGGPFEHIPALRDAFCRVTGLPPEQVTVPKDAHLFVVRGAALAREKSRAVRLSELLAQVRSADFSSQEGIKRLPPLFSDADELEQFRRRHAARRIPRVHLIDSTENLFLGIDAGSTTMKMALVDENGALCAYEYDWNEGDVTVSLSWMLKSMYRQIHGKWIPPKTIRRSCIVGYGEDFCQAAYGIDEGEVETVAHLRAATALDPEVDFLMDIGGQDIKCFYVQDGVICDIVLNEACSSGCGSLFDSVARSMRKTKEGLATEALFAKAPVDLGTRCTTFMDSRVKHAQKEGATQGDIAAGICYSTAKNALFKVVRQPDFSKVGEHVVVQGGAFANDALLRAFELECGREVTRPDLPQLMGAYGAALLARDRWMSLAQRDPQAARAARSTLVTREQLASLGISKGSMRCAGCGNACKLMVTRFEQRGDAAAGVRSYVTGNRCERGAALCGAAAASAKRPPNMVKLKNALIAAYDRHAGGSAEERSLVETGANIGASASDRPVVGIPKVLALYESYPFWRTFFDALGVPVLACSPSDDAVFRAGMGCIPAEGACYPSKLMFGHAADLVQRGAQVLFVPKTSLAFARAGMLGREMPEDVRDCPLIEQMPELLQDNAAGSVLAQARFAAPDLLQARSLEDAAEPLRAALAGAGLPFSEGEVEAALGAAREEYVSFFAKLDSACAKALARVDAGEFPGALVAGHPYHADPGVNHGIDELLGDLGYAVFEQVDYGFSAHGVQDEFAWTPTRDLFYAQEKSAGHPNLQFIIARSFGCGIDAVAADAVHGRLKESGRIYAELKLDQIVDLAAIRIRLRSLDYATRQRAGEVVTQVVELVDVNGRAHDAAAVPSGRRDLSRSRLRSAGGEAASPMGEGAAGADVLGGVPAGSGVTGAPAANGDLLAGRIDMQGVVAGMGAAPDAPAPGQRSLSTADVGVYYSKSTGELGHEGTLKQMADAGYEFVVDRVTHVQYLSFFSYIIFSGPNGAVYFDTWDAVERFVESGFDEHASVKGMRTSEEVPAEPAVKPTDPRNAGK